MTDLKSRQKLATETLASAHDALHAPVTDRVKANKIHVALAAIADYTIALAIHDELTPTQRQADDPS